MKKLTVLAAALAALFTFVVDSPSYARAFTKTAFSVRVDSSQAVTFTCSADGPEYIRYPGGRSTIDRCDPGRFMSIVLGPKERIDCHNFTTDRDWDYYNVLTSEVRVKFLGTTEPMGQDWKCSDRYLP